MAKLHHMKLKSAINKYQPLFTEGMSDEGMKALIADDESEFTDDEVYEIFSALAKPESEMPPAPQDFRGAYIVVSPFRDINNFNLKHEPGADVSYFDAVRIEKLLKMGLIEKQ
jgi:hypothetical protein